MMTENRINIMFMILWTLLLSSCEATGDTSRKLTVINRSGVRVELYWINRWKNDERVLNTEEGILNGADTGINSYLGHEFEVVELPSKKTGVCRSEECMTAIFQVNANDGQIVTIEEGLAIKHEDDKTKARDQAGEIVRDCKAQFAEKKGDPYKLLEELSECFEASVNKSVSLKDDEKKFNAEIRTSLGTRLADYICTDVNATTSAPIKNQTWAFEDEEFDVRAMMDRPHIKVHLVEDFITPEECQAVERLITTKRVDANGLLAKKGGISFLSAEKDSVLSSLESRMYTYANEELGVVLESEESEELYLLHYEGRGEDDAKPDQYAVHCDGKCDGSDVKRGDRIATMILYCQVAQKGGATHFPDSGIHIKPKAAGDMLFYSYIDKTTKVMDTGMSKHTGCQVVEGEKKILTHKFRLG